jgi:hypothetical protein
MRNLDNNYGIAIEFYAPQLSMRIVETEVQHAP